MTDEELALAEMKLVNAAIVEATQDMDTRQREFFFRMVIGSLMGMIDKVNPHAAEIAFPGIAKTARLHTLMEVGKRGAVRRRII